MRIGKIVFSNQTPSLFDHLAGRVDNYAPPRSEHIARAFEKADAVFVERYGLFLISFGMRHKDFIAGEVTAEYETKYGPITLKQKKALGKLYQTVQRTKLIEKTGGYRARNQGNASAIYRLKQAV